MVAGAARVSHTYGMDNDTTPLTDKQIEARRGALSRRAAQANSRFLIARGAAAGRGSRIETATVAKARRAAETARDAITAFNRQYPEA